MDARCSELVSERVELQKEVERQREIAAEAHAREQRVGERLAIEQADRKTTDVFHQQTEQEPKLELGLGLGLDLGL